MKRKELIIDSRPYYIRHPENLFCPICGCGCIPFWPELFEWNTWDDAKKKLYEICPCCDYGNPEYPMDVDEFLEME